MSEKRYNGYTPDHIAAAAPGTMEGELAIDLLQARLRIAELDRELTAVTLAMPSRGMWEATPSQLAAEYARLVAGFEASPAHKEGLEWTSEWPREPGRYWFQDRCGFEGIVKVTELGNIPGLADGDFDGALFAGPIARPREILPATEPK